MKKVMMFSLMLMLIVAMPVFGAGVTLSESSVEPTTYVLGFMPDPGHSTGTLSATNDGAGDEQMYGQTFLTGDAFNLGAVLFKTGKDRAYGASQVLEVAILDNSNVLVAGPFSCLCPSTTTGNWVKLKFDAPIALAAATSYRYVYTLIGPMSDIMDCYGDRSGGNFADSRMVSQTYVAGTFPTVAAPNLAGRDMYFALEEYSGVNLPPTVNPTADPASPANPANPQSGEGIHLVETDPNQALLDAGASDPEGDPLTYAWTIASQPGTATLDDSTIATPTLLNADVLGDYVVDVVVTATAGDMTPVPGSVTVTVLDNWAPNCNILDDESPGTIHYDEEVRWNADKGDPDGLNALLTFEWTSDPVGVKFIDPATGLADNTVEDPNVALITPDLANVGTYEVQLLVTDPGGLTVTDVRTLTVIANVDPIADAGDETAFISIADGGTLALNGVVPADDGYPLDPGVLTITWEADDVLVDIADPSAAVTTADFNAAGEGEYVLTLTADDGGGNPAIDTIVVTVTPYATAFITLNPIDDSFVRSTRGDWNFGRDNTLGIENSLENQASEGKELRLGLLKFDVNAGVPGA
ncbi:MAG: cadherin repeat domain-containing protein, partial [Gammaproteobacteria bacterium]|nr:cadherin repeat domain-containing protein [Gammaproteobacteria bacterium]